MRSQWKSLFFFILLVLFSVAGASAQHGKLAHSNHGSLPGRGIHPLTSTPVPVSGAHVYLFAVSSDGYDTDPTSLLAGTGVTTDANGNGYVVSASDGTFSLTGLYTCTAGDVPVYLLATGGIEDGTAINDQLSLVTALPPTCSNLSSASSVYISEATTIAAAFALAPYATQTATPADGLASASDTTTTTALSTAFAYANSMVSGYDGSYGTAAPTNMINTLSDILFACTGGDSGSTACTDLLEDTTIQLTEGSSTTTYFYPVDTWQAAVGMAYNISSNNSALYGLISGTPYSPILTSAPDTWTITPSAGPHLTGYHYETLLRGGHSMYYVCLDGTNFSTASPSTDVVVFNGVAMDYTQFVSNSSTSICLAYSGPTYVSLDYMQVMGTTYGSEIQQVKPFLTPI